MASPTAQDLAASKAVGPSVFPESRVRLSGRLMRYPGKPLRVDVDELRLWP
ncbi:hypothetical protein [uncultured Desulfovibrio sp.]|uniref:hypothetical protein n=1 Tax=uncultured Desulfovibrio sp. TaxID=167968 RepID=UPI0026158594|nr:hypothetical protein [uncultured Desulfovibrio sp.]